jgi:hypothetical protein
MSLNAVYCLVGWQKSETGSACGLFNPVTTSFIYEYGFENRKK